MGRWNESWLVNINNCCKCFWVQSACSLLVGMGDDTMHASSVLAMPMVSSKMTGFRGGDRSKLISLRSPTGWSRIPVEETVNMLDTTSSEED